MDKDQDIEVELYQENVEISTIALPPVVDRHLLIDFRKLSHPKNPPKELDAD